MTATAPRFGPSRVRLLLAAIVLAGTLFGALLAGASPASAHAALTGSDPQDGAVVATAPKEVTLTFSEQVAMADDSIRVLDPKRQARRQRQAVRDLAPAATSPTASSCTPGCPTARTPWPGRRSPPTAIPSPAPSPSPSARPPRPPSSLPDQRPAAAWSASLYGIARYAAYAGFIAARRRRRLRARLLAARRRRTAAAAARRPRLGRRSPPPPSRLLLLRGPVHRLRASSADVFDLGGLQDVLRDQDRAPRSVSRLLLLGAAALFIAVLFGAYAQAARTRSEKKDLTFGLAIGGAVVAAGIAATWAMAEHASTGIQPGIAMPVDMVHLLAVAAWLGGLAALLVALYRAPCRSSAAAVRRFSRVAFGSVLVLVATGLYQSWRQVGSWSALTGTAYGQLLLVKVAWSSCSSASRGSRGGGRRGCAEPGDARPTRRPAAGSGAARRSDGGTRKPDGRRTSRPRPARTGRPAEPVRERAAQLARQQAADGAARRSGRGRRPGRAPGCAAPCWPRRASPWCCSPSPPC